MTLPPSSFQRAASLAQVCVLCALAWCLLLVLHHIVTNRRISRCCTSFLTWVTHNTSLEGCTSCSALLISPGLLCFYIPTGFWWDSVQQGKVESNGTRCTSTALHYGLGEVTTTLQPLSDIPQQKLWKFSDSREHGRWNILYLSEYRNNTQVKVSLRLQLLWSSKKIIKKKKYRFPNTH